MTRHKILFAHLTMAGLLTAALLPGAEARAEETRDTETRSREVESRSRRDTVDTAEIAGKVEAENGAGAQVSATPVQPPVQLSSTPSTLASAAPVALPESSTPERTTLTGDWGGLRPHLQQKGFTFRADYVSETFAITDGGLRRGDGYSQQLRGGVDVDLAKTIGWTGALFHFTVNDRRGVGVSSQVVGNRLPIQEDAGGNFTKLTEFSIEQNFAKGRLNVRLGYFAMGNDLGGLSVGCTLVNAAFCAHALSFSGDTGWYNYPNARWGMAVRYHLRPELTIRTGIYQVNADLSLKQNGFKPFVGGSTGFLVPIELEYDPGTTVRSAVLPGHYKVGFYYDTTDVARQGASGRVSGRYGAYILADQMILRGRGKRGLSVFGELAANPRDSATITRWYAAGLIQTGTFAGRDSDTVALGIIQARVNPRLRDIHMEDLEQSSGSFTSLPVGETAIELNYGIQLRRYLSIRPDAQYIIDPGAFSFRNTRNAVALGGQVKMQF